MYILQTCPKRIHIIESHRWDALIFGEHNLIDRSRVPPWAKRETLLSFHDRDLNTRNAPREIQALQDLFEEKAKAGDIRLSLRSGYSNTITGHVEQQINYYGLTSLASLRDEPSPIIHISIEELQPLMTGGLNDAEMLARITLFISKESLD